MPGAAQSIELKRSLFPLGSYPTMSAQLAPLFAAYEAQDKAEVWNIRVPTRS